MNWEKLKKPQHALPESSIKVTNKVSLLSFLNRSELLPFAMLHACVCKVQTCTKCNVTRLYIKIPTCVAANTTNQVWRTMTFRRLCIEMCSLLWPFDETADVKRICILRFGWLYYRDSFGGNIGID
jgi:hypothetical protein